MKKKIMVVEDEFLIGWSLVVGLEDFGYDCELVSRGEEAVELAKSLKPDLIIMDICLAGNMNGIEAAQIIKAEHDCRFVFITGYHVEKFIKQVKDIDPVAVMLQKPVLLDEIKKIIETCDG